MPLSLPFYVVRMVSHECAERATSHRVDIIVKRVTSSVFYYFDSNSTALENEDVFTGKHLEANLNDDTIYSKLIYASVISVSYPSYLF